MRPSLRAKGENIIYKYMKYKRRQIYEIWLSSNNRNVTENIEINLLPISEKRIK